MIVILKSFNGTDYKVQTSKGIKIISLKGGCFMNEISKDDWKLLTSQYKEHFEELIGNGFVVINDVKDSDAKSKENNAVDDTLQDTKDKQDNAHQDNKALKKN